MKLYGVFGKGSGKVGSSVFAISGGEQIVRQHNPVVANPQTEGQVAQRAKLKLMSQLAATMALVIAFRKQGLISARNQFVSKNIGLCTYTAEGGAVCDLSKIDLTGGTLILPEISVVDASGATGVSLETRAAESIKRVLYAGFIENENGGLTLVDSILVSVPGAGRSFQGTLNVADQPLIVYAYGIADANNGVTAKFDDYIADLDEHEASLLVVRSLSASANTLSETKYKKYNVG